MDWNALGASAELAAAIAVVASLLYLGRQVRQSNRIARAEAFREVQLKLVDILGDWANDQAWTSLLIRIRYQGLTRSSMTPDERNLAGFRFQAFIAIYSIVFRDVRLGLLPEAAYDIQAEDMFRTPYFRELWPLLAPDHSADFAAFMDGRFGLSRETPQTFVEAPPGSQEASLRRG